MKNYLGKILGTSALLIGLATCGRVQDSEVIKNYSGKLFGKNVRVETVEEITPDDGLFIKDYIIFCMDEFEMYADNKLHNKVLGKSNHYEIDRNRNKIPDPGRLWIKGKDGKEYQITFSHDKYGKIVSLNYPNVMNSNNRNKIPESAGLPSPNEIADSVENLVMEAVEKGQKE